MNNPDPARGWLYIENLLHEEENERIKSLSDAELRAELAQGADGAAAPETEWSADELLARARDLAAKKRPTAGSAAPEPVPAPRPEAPPAAPRRPRAPVIPIWRSWRAIGLVAAACVALFLFVKASERPDVSARPTGRDLANAEREQAFASCALKEWSACKAKLDDAARLDPAGESEPRVQQARREIESAPKSP